MAFLRYYTDERERHPILHRTRCTEEEAVVAVRKLHRHFLGDDGGAQPTEVVFTSGNRSSHAGYGRTITLNRDALTWLLVAHEFAHRWDSRRFHRGLPSGSGWHDRHHARLVTRVCRYIERKGWHTGAIAHDLALAHEREQQRQARAACPPPLDARIEKRRQQVKRLTTKIKGLTTRLRSAQRSLRALERVAQHRGRP
jgi:hypothetical protein